MHLPVQKLNLGSNSKNNYRRPKTIWMIISTYFASSPLPSGPLVGGAEQQLRNLSGWLISSGYQIRIITRRHAMSGETHGPAKDSIDGVQVTRVFSRGWGKLSSLFFVLAGLWHLFLHGRNAIYHAHDVGAPGWFAVIASHLLRGKSIVKIRSGKPAYEETYTSWLDRTQFSLLLRLADKVHVVNKELEQFVASRGVDPSRTAFIPNAVDTKQFRPPSIEERKNVRTGLGISDSKHVVLYAGRFEAVKGVDSLLQAWALLPIPVLEKSVLVLIGKGSAEANLKGIIRSLNLQQTVIMAGAQTDVLKYYWASNLFVSPSRSEGMSNALNEAMACGLPVIASKSSGSLDLVIDGQNGVTFEQGNVCQLEH